MTATVKQDADGMAACIADLAKNAADGKDLMDGTDSYNISDKVSNKIFILTRNTQENKNVKNKRWRPGGWPATFSKVVTQPDGTA